MHRGAQGTLVASRSPRRPFAPRQCGTASQPGSPFLTRASGGECLLGDQEMEVSGFVLETIVDTQDRQTPPPQGPSERLHLWCLFIHFYTVHTKQASQDPLGALGGERGTGQKTQSHSVCPEPQQPHLRSVAQDRLPQPSSRGPGGVFSPFRLPGPFQEQEGASLCEPEEETLRCL